MSVNIRNVILILLVVMLGAFSLSAMFGGLQINFWGWTPVGDSVAQVDMDQTFAADEISAINISTVSTSVNIIETDSDEIRVHLYGSASEFAVPDLLAEQRGDRLNINVEPRRVTGTVILRLKLDIYVPAGYEGSLRMGTVSGKMTIGNFNLDSLNYSSVSGRLEAGTINTRHTEIRTTSGSAKIEGLTGNLEFRTVSGDLDVRYDEFDNNIFASTTSGSVRVKLPQDAEFHLEASSVSGKIKSDFPITVTGQTRNNQLVGTAGSDRNSINIKTVSGSITINN